LRYSILNQLFQWAARLSAVVVLSGTANAYDTEINLDWRGTFAQVKLSDSQSGTIASPIGLSSAYLVTLSERFSIGIGYGLAYAGQTVLLHGPFGTLRTLVLGGRSFIQSDSALQYSVQRRFALYVPIGMGGTFYDFKNVFGTQGLVKRGAADLSGFSLGSLAGLELEIPFGSGILSRFGSYFVASTGPVSAARILQIQTTVGLVKEF